MAQFCNVIDVTGIAAKVIWLNIYPDWYGEKQNERRKIFLKKLVEELVVPNIQRRSTLRLQKTTTGIIDQVMSNCNFSAQNQIQVQPMPISNSTKRRCYMCPQQLGRMNRQICSCCHKNVCIEHSEKLIICKNCINK